MPPASPRTSRPPSLGWPTVTRRWRNFSSSGCSTNNFIFTLTVDGKKNELTRDEITTYVKDNRAAVRKAAYQELYRAYAKHSDVLSDIYRNVVLDLKNECIGLRKYHSPINVMNIANDVSDEAISTMLSVCRKNRFLFQEYFKLKSKLCKIKKMTRYDIYTHYKEKSKKYSYKLLIYSFFQIKMSEENLNLDSAEDSRINFVIATIL